MKYFIAFILCCFALIPTKNSHAVEYAQNYVSNFQKLGEGRFSYMIWDVYDAALYAPSGQWKSGEPVILTLSYLRNLKGKKIAKSSIDEIKKQGLADQSQLDQWYQDMLTIFPDVGYEDVITGIYTPQKETIFYKNSKKIGSVTDPIFGEAFFNIWLGKTTVAPDLRAQLLGIESK